MDNQHLTLSMGTIPLSLVATISGELGWGKPPPHTAAAPYHAYWTKHHTSWPRYVAGSTEVLAFTFPTCYTRNYHLPWPECVGGGQSIFLFCTLAKISSWGLFLTSSQPHTMLVILHITTPWPGKHCYQFQLWFGLAWPQTYT